MDSSEVFDLDDRDNNDDDPTCFPPNLCNAGPSGFAISTGAENHVEYESLSGSPSSFQMRIIGDSVTTTTPFKSPEISDLSGDSILHPYQQSTTSYALVSREPLPSNRNSGKDPTPNSATRQSYLDFFRRSSRQDRLQSNSRDAIGKNVEEPTSHTRLSAAQERIRRENINNLTQAKAFNRYTTQDNLRIITSVPVKDPDSSVRSPWWMYFKVFDTNCLAPEDKSKYKSLAACILCRDAAIELDDPSIKFHVNMSLCMSTSKLKSHLRIYHPSQFEEIDSKIVEEQSDTSSDIRSYCTLDKSKKIYEEELLKLIIGANLPLSFSSNKYFRSFMNKCGKYTFPVHRTQISNLVLRHGSLLKKILSEKLRGIRFSVTTDGWTSKAQGCSYLALTAHSITKDFELRKFALACRPHNGTSLHTDLAVEITNVLDSYDVLPSSVNTFVSDTNSTMTKLAGYLRDSFGIGWCGCIDHRIQLVSKLAFDDKNLPHAGKCMQRARNLVSFLRHSPQATQAFKNLQVMYISLQ